MSARVFQVPANVLNSANFDAARRALAARRATNFTTYPDAAQTANDGMSSLPAAGAK